MSTTDATGTTILNKYGQTLNIWVSTEPNGANPNVVQLNNGQGVNAKPDLTFFQIQSASSSSVVPPTNGWGNATQISNQLDDSVTVRFYPPGTSPVLMGLSPKSAVDANAGITQFEVHPA